MTCNYGLDLIGENYKARYEDDSSVTSNICNFGIKKGQKAKLMRKGEYYGFAIEALENIRPLLTNYTIKYILDNYENKDKIIKHFYLESYYTKYGDELIDYVVEKFYKNNNIEDKIPGFIKRENNIKDETIDKWIKMVRHDTLEYKLKIYGAGDGKKCTVVPENWIDKEFDSGKELHLAMDKLEWRKGKPQCSFCCIYSMQILDDLLYIDSLDNISDKEYDVIIIIYDNKKNNIKTFAGKKDKKGIQKFKTDKNTKYLVIDDLIIIYDKTICNEKPKYTKSEPVSYLASTLQKCVRRGPENFNLVQEILEKMNNSSFYTLPEQNFAKISGSRQMMWRSFISIIEDCSGYIKSDDMLDIKDMCLMAILCQYDINIQFNENILKLLKNSMTEVVNYKKLWDWRKCEEFNEEKTKVPDDLTFFSFAKKYMPMMSGDKQMINQIMMMLSKNYELEILKVKKYKSISDKIKEKDTLCAGFDMHCKPSIILHTQSEIDFIKNREKYDTHNISKFIWENSSRITWRIDHLTVMDKLNTNDKDVYKKMKDVQQNLHYKLYEKDYKEDELKENFKNIYDICFSKHKFKKANPKNDSKSDIKGKAETREIFLLLFGQKIKYNRVEILVCGTNENPIKIKKYNSETKKMEFVDGNNSSLQTRIIGDAMNHQNNDSVIIGMEKKYLEYLDSLPNKSIKIQKPKLLEKFSWIKDFENKSYLTLKCEYKDNKYHFYVENHEVFPFDCTSIVESLPKYESKKIEESEFSDLVEQMLFNKKSYDNINYICRYLSDLRKDKKNFTLYDWKDKNKDIPSSVWKKIYSKILIESDTITVGPVDRHGDKTYNSIDYVYEGVLLRLLNLLCLLYPDCIISSGELVFRLNKRGIGYNHMIDSLKHLSFVSKIFKKENDTNIKTKLWEHQEKSVKKFYNAHVELKKMGCGDSSRVGSGKTLVALSLMSKLHNINSDMNYGGFLILTPNARLYDTWESEIKNHTQNFEYILYDGKLKKEIKRNTIVISTLGRMRDHPISNNWIYVVIDECLSVQNKEALHTEEALRQIMSSQYGICLLSATFFRSRIDKLYYMLKMLRSGLPLDHRYLDTILSESIICNNFNTDRTWYSTEHKLYLDNAQQKKYDSLLEKHKNKTDEEKYSILVKYIHDNCDYVSYFNQTIKKLEKERKDCKILIFTKSKNEAEKLAESNKNIGLYPDIKQKHVCGSITELAHGINNLVIFDTILMRPPNFDILPQCKGRLDRPGQKSKNLYLEYLYLDKTIEIAGMYKIAMGNNFYENHILPLAEFYKIAIEGKI
jgi:hypothetical protein